MKIDLKVVGILSVLWIKIMAAPIVFIDFKIHQERLAREECVERYAFITICRANCVLESKIKLATETKKRNESIKTNKYQEWLFIEDLPKFPLPKKKVKKSGFHFPTVHSPGFSNGIDKPPQFYV